MTVLAHPMPGCATTAAGLHSNGDMWRISSNDFELHPYDVEK
jgi:hypothetical protein